MNPYLVSWLRFNDENDIAKDECGNTWTAYGTVSISQTNAIYGNALQLNKSYLRSDSAIEFGGADFTVDFYGYMDSSSEPWAGVFCAQSTIATRQESQQGQISLHCNKNVTKLLCEVYDSNSTNTAYATLPNTNLLNARHHLELDYSHSDSTLKVFVDGELNSTRSTSIERLARYIFFGANSYYPPTQRMVGSFDDFRLFDGIALHTENFTPPTTEADYDLTELSFSVFMPATRSIIKPIDELANVKRTVNKTADESANLASSVVRSENIFSNVNRTVDKSAEEFSNVKRTVNFSTVNDFSPIRRTVNVDDNFANVKRTVNFSTENFSATKRGVVFSEEYDFQPQRRLTNLADEFAPVRRLVHEPQVVDVYTRRRLTNLDDNFADVRRKILSTSDNAIDLSRAVIFTADNFSPTKRTVNKTATESADTKRQILFSADNDCANVRRVINADENFANVTSNIIKTADNFSPTKRETLRSEICYVETSRRAELLSVIVALKNQQGNVLGYIRFQKDKTSSIGHLVTHFNGINFYAGLVEVDSPSASNFRVRAYGMVYALKEEFL